ncbi:hypothetical protein OESDEN_05950 [Oesophagostomum dentatum]|uniref:Uncharacterized protein n=1 Tax=Oesophagostomum dentatum TaxID=61180 RepID=A0A0B1TDH0_OESDE|nr:hypothetical protein OESDEN_05950 [Oesophagostomum dentatum]
MLGKVKQKELTIRCLQKDNTMNTEEKRTLLEHVVRRRRVSRNAADTTHATQLLGSTPGTSSSSDYSEYSRHQCNDLCKRVRCLTAKMLTAPFEKSCEAVRYKSGIGRASLGGEAKNIIMNVKIFFEELKGHLGVSCYGTILNTPLQMASLACGVGASTVARIAKIGPIEVERPKRVRTVVEEPKKLIPLKLELMKKYSNEWGEVVRHFVNDVLEKEEDITVTELYDRLIYAYADFPMEPSALYTFLKALGFSYRVEGNRSYITSM